MSTVLIVDDDASTRVVLRLVLETAGFEVVEAEHGEAALAHFSLKPPDIITTDLKMPVLSGEALIERLRSHPKTASIPIVVVSGNSTAAKALHSSGRVEAVVNKPFSAVDLADCVRALISNIGAIRTDVLAS
jgi:CheY-like chemotaxis protein